MSPAKLGILVKLDEDQLQKLTRLADATRVARSAYIREAIDDLLIKHKDKIPVPELSVNMKALAEQAAKAIRTAAAVDVDGLVASGDLKRDKGGWYLVRDLAVFDKIHLLIKEIEHREVAGEYRHRVKLEPVKAFKALAAKHKL